MPRVFRDDDGVPYVAWDEVEDLLKVKTMQKKFRDDFNGSSIDLSKWDVSVGSGMAVDLSGGNLRIQAGTVASAETVVATKELFTIPMRALVAFYLSQRIANQQFFLEFVSEDGQDLMGWLFEGTTATYGKFQVANGGASPLVSGYVTILSTASLAVAELEAFVDEAYFHSRYVDSTGTRSYSFVRHRNIPDPNKKYRFRIRALNGSTAPASNTILYVDSVAIQDYAELTAEITAGRGMIAGGQGIAAYIVGGGPTAYCYNRLAWYTDSTTPLGANATFTGTSRDTGATGSWGRFRARAYADQPGTLYIDQSRDNSTWRTTDSVAVGAGEVKFLEAPIMARYVRVRYVNGSTAQGAFELISALVGI